jgi:hypothetical protein
MEIFVVGFVVDVGGVFVVYHGYCVVDCDRMMVAACGAAMDVGFVDVCARDVHVIHVLFCVQVQSHFR